MLKADVPCHALSSTHPGDREGRGGKKGEGAAEGGQAGEHPRLSDPAADHALGLDLVPQTPL